MSLAFVPAAPKVGSLVSVRGRDWVVLPAPEEHVVRLRPLTGTEEDAIGVYLPLERLSPSQFPAPIPENAGDVAGGILLLDAARLALRDGAAPFRSLGRLSVTPRPYQFVPLIMALRQNRVRLLIADDVGVGKTIEAGMIARELLDRGLAKRLGVICPAHLCDQWEAELREKFGIEAAGIQPSRYARLERDLPRQDVSVFRHHRHLVASIDFIKNKNGPLREAFIQNAPDLIIVDEAHASARPRSDSGKVEQQRYEFLHDLMLADPNRQLLLVTATPHSGIEESFRSLLGLLDPAFDAGLGSQDAPLDRDALIPYVIQRRRTDLQRWHGSDTPFPERLPPVERTFALNRDYHALFDAVLAYCRDAVAIVPGAPAHHQRVRYWAAISLLRCVISSPRAAAAVLGGRARRKGIDLAIDEGRTGEAADALYRPQVIDSADEESALDLVPAAPIEDAEAFLKESERRKLSDFSKRARELEGPVKDAKLAELGKALAEQLREGFHPIVFCHYIPTAKYIADYLPKMLKGEFGAVSVTAVTGEIGDEERRAKIAGLVDASDRRVLVATDCISEGINLQDHFDSVIHYDLPWNPNRIEQREGRVDRFGQTSPKVMRTLIYGADNLIDPLVMQVLIRKHLKIREDLGFSLPVSGENDQVVESVVESVLLNRTAPSAGRGAQLAFSFEGAEVSRLHVSLDRQADQQKRERQFFAQRGIKPDEVMEELHASDRVLGDPGSIERFLKNALDRLGGSLRATKADGVFDLIPGDLAPALRARGLNANSHRVVFDRANDPAAVYLGRTHPIVAACCDAVLGGAMALNSNPAFARSGARITAAVTRPTAVVLLRVRYLLKEAADEFAEEVVIAAFEFGRVERPSPPAPRILGEGSPAAAPTAVPPSVILSEVEGPLRVSEPAVRDPLSRYGGGGSAPRAGVVWLQPWEEAARDLLSRATPAANISASERVAAVRSALGALTPGWQAPIVAWRVEEIQRAHNRLRKLTKHAAIAISPHDPPDILGLYVLLPVGEVR